MKFDNIKRFPEGDMISLKKTSSSQVPLINMQQIKGNINALMEVNERKRIDKNANQRNVLSP